MATVTECWQGACANGHVDTHWVRAGWKPRIGVGYALPTCQFNIRDGNGRGRVIGTCGADVTWYSPTGKRVDIFGTVSIP